MPDIFNVQPPAWLQDLTRSNDKGLLGGIGGELAASPLIAMTKVSDDIKKAKEDAIRTGQPYKSPNFGERASMWLHDLPKSVGEAHLNFLDPMWKIKVQQQQVQIANLGLGLQERQQKLNANAEELRNEAEDVQAIPAWLRDHNSPGARLESSDRPVPKSQKWQRFMHNMDMSDDNFLRQQNNSVQSRITVEGVKAFNDRVKELGKTDPVAAAQIATQAGQWISKGQMPPPNITDQLVQAEQARKASNQQRLEDAIKQAEESGGTVERKFGPTGETVTVKPGATGAAATPKIQDLEGGFKIVWMPGAKTLHIVHPNGDKKEMTPTQLNSIANSLLSGDKENHATGEKILKFLGETAVKQVEGSALDLPATKDKLVKGKRYKTARGIAEWDGTQFQPVE